MLLYLLPLVAILPLAVVFICGKPSNKENSSSKSTPETTTTNVSKEASPVAVPAPPVPQPAVAAPPAIDAAPPEAPKSDEKKEEKETYVGPIDATVPQVAYLLSSEERINEEWLRSLTTTVDRICQYQWAVKKRLAADDNSWKEIGKKIQKFKDEGFGNKNVHEDPRYVISKDDNKKKGYKKSSFKWNKADDEKKEKE